MGWQTRRLQYCGFNWEADQCSQSQPRAGSARQVLAGAAGLSPATGGTRGPADQPPIGGLFRRNRQT